MIAKSAPKKHSRKFRFNLLPLIFSFIFAALLWILFSSNLQMGQRRQQLLSRIKDLQKNITAIEQRNEELKANLFSMTDENFLEKEAREKFQLQKPGEKVVSIIMPSGTPESTSNETSKTLWQQILEKLGF
jgi:cell division protein FtsB